MTEEMRLLGPSLSGWARQGPDGTREDDEGNGPQQANDMVEDGEALSDRLTREVLAPQGMVT